MSAPALCCLLIDVDGFLPQEARATDGWGERTRERIRGIIDDCVGHDAAYYDADHDVRDDLRHGVGDGGTRVEHLPPDEWLLVLRAPTADGLRRRAERMAAGIHRAVRESCDVTVTVGVGQVVTGPQAAAEAVSSARQAHRAKLAAGPDRVISLLPAAGERPPHAPRGIHRELAHAIGRGHAERAGRLLWDWFARATEAAAGDDELVRRWMLGQVLATVAALDGRLGGSTGSDWMAVCESVPYPVLAELADLHEPSTVATWTDRVVESLVAQQRATSPRTTTLELVRRHVDEHFTDPRMRLEDVAAEIGVSPFHVSHLFRSGLGTTYRDYVTQRRVRLAQRLLEQTRLGMAQVASASGFTSPVQLRRVLVRETGATPSAIRQAARERRVPQAGSPWFEPLDQQPEALPRASAAG